MNTLQWTIELHSHTIYSRDCLVRLDDLQDICRSAGIDKLAITDHNTAQAALEMARLYPMLIIPGEEIMTTHGELLGWYIRSEVPPGLSPQETIQRLREQDAVVGIAHPFDRYRRGAWTADALLEIIDLIDVVEVFNSRCLRNEDNERALAFAQRHGKLLACGSDAHTRPEFGRAVLVTQPFANNAHGLRAALVNAHRQEQLSPFTVHFASTYAKWAKRLVRSLHPS